VASQEEIGSSGGAARGPAFFLHGFLLVFCFLVLSLLAIPADGGVYWPEAQVLVSGIASYTSLKLDAFGRPHLAYHDYLNRDLCYGWRGPSGAWIFETVDSAGDVGRFASLELSSTGLPCIAYHDFTKRVLKYAEKREDGWHIEELGPFPCSGIYSSLALDSADQPHIAFSSCSLFDLYYARRDSSGQWIFETVDSAGDVGLYCSLRLHDGLPRISYYDKTSGHLKYAEKDAAGKWTLATVDSSPRCGLDTSLALDPSGAPHISYWDQENGHLKYATCQGGNWTVETVDSEGYAGYESCIAAIGWPRISYEGARGLRYAERVDGCWRIYRIEEGGSAAGYTSLAVDQAGNPRVSYFRYLSHTVEYREGVESGAPGAPSPIAAASIGGASGLPDGTWLALPGSPVVSAGSSAGWHLEAADRSAGIHLKMPQECQMPSEGDEVEVVGVLETSQDKERRIQVCEWRTTGSPGAPEPVFIAGPYSLAAGLLVRMAGAARVEAGRLYLGEAEIMLGPGWSPPGQGSFVVATGILRSVAAGYILSPRREEDIVVLAF